MAWNLPGYGTPQAINFAPIGNALTGIRQQRNVEAEQARKNMLLEMQKQQMAQANARANAAAGRWQEEMQFKRDQANMDRLARDREFGLRERTATRQDELYNLQKSKYDEEANQRRASKRAQLAMIANDEQWKMLSQRPEFAGKTREQVIAEGGLGREYMDFRLKQAKLPNPQQNAGNIAQGLSNLASIPKNYDAFDYATGEWRGDDKALLGPIGRAWGSVTSGIAGTQTSPGEVRRQIAGSTEALAASLKPLIRKPGEGTWTDADQARLVALVGDLAKANTRQQYYRALEGVRQRVRDNFGLNLPPIQGMPQGFYEQQTGKPQGRAPALFQGFSAKEIR